MSKNNEEPTDMPIRNPVLGGGEDSVKKSKKTGLVFR
jgi:hypothetical protein